MKKSFCLKTNIVNFTFALFAVYSNGLYAADFNKTSAVAAANIQVDKLSVVDELGNRYSNTLRLVANDAQLLYVGQKFSVIDILPSSPGVEDGALLVKDRTLVIPKLLYNQLPAYNLTMKLTSTEPYELTVTGLGVFGSQGVKGDPGVQGLKGDAGAKGAIGDKGATGEKGPTGPIGPIGLTGPQGSVGATGPTGATGPAGSADSWGRLGNAGTTDGTNFIGTTDGAPLNFRVNNVYAGRIDATGDKLFFGLDAGKKSTGLRTTGFGSQSLSNNTTGSNNSAQGYAALRANTIGSDNTASGTGALAINVDGSSNTVSGSVAMYSNIHGSLNTAIGYQALYNNTVGNSNTAIGESALFALSAGSNNTAIGANAQVPNKVGSNQVRIGNADVTYAGVQVGWTITSDSRWKADIQGSNLGLAFVKALKPVVYTRNNDASKSLEYGFIAQDVEALLKTMNINNAGMLTQDSNGMYSVRYNDFFAPIVKAVQEQQAMIEQQQAMLIKQQALIDALLKR